MFKAMLFAFLAGVVADQTLQEWASDGGERVSLELSALFHIDAYEKLVAALR